MVSKWLGFSGVLFAGKNSYYRVTAQNGMAVFTGPTKKRRLGDDGA